MHEWGPEQSNWIVEKPDFTKFKHKGNQKCKSNEETKARAIEQVARG